MFGLKGRVVEIGEVVVDFGRVFGDGLGVVLRNGGKKGEFGGEVGEGLRVCLV